MTDTRTSEKLLTDAAAVLTEAARRRVTIGQGTEHDQTRLAEFASLALAGAVANIGSIEGLLAARAGGETVAEASDFATQAVEAMTAAADVSAAGGQDFAEWLSQVLATTAAIKGSSYALLAGRPGSWESAYVRDLLGSTVGVDDEHLSDYLPDGFRPPVSGVVLYQAADLTLWLRTTLWDDSVDPNGPSYVRTFALDPHEDLWDDGQQWITGQVDPAADGRWVAAELPEDVESSHRHVGTLHKDGTGVWFEPADGLEELPLAVRRYCQTDEASRLEDEETQTQDRAIAELAVLAGEMSAEDQAAGVIYESPEERSEVAMLYATALGLARHDDAAFERAREIKRGYDAWWDRWHHFYPQAARNDGL